MASHKTDLTRLVINQAIRATAQNIGGDPVIRYVPNGRRCFTDQAKAAGLNRPPPDSELRSLLDRIVLDVDKPEMAVA